MTPRDDIPPRYIVAFHGDRRSNPDVYAFKTEAAAHRAKRAWEKAFRETSERCVVYSIEALAVKEVKP